MAGDSFTTVIAAYQRGSEASQESRRDALLGCRSGRLEGLCHGSSYGGRKRSDLASHTGARRRECGRGRRQRAGGAVPALLLRLLVSAGVGPGALRPARSVDVVGGEVA